MTRTALALRHVPFEDLGLLGPLLADRGYDVSYVDTPVDRVLTELVLDAHLLVVLGGPISVYDTATYPFLVPELAAIKARLATDRPTLGICLGAQFMATALGAMVAPTGRTQIGYEPVQVPEGAGPLALLGNAPVLHWHGDAFEIPDGATRLASSPGYPNQAFGIGDRQLALQFHLEADPRQLEAWLVGHAVELATRGIDPRELRAQALSYGSQLAERGRAVFHAWLDRAEA